MNGLDFLQQLIQGLQRLLQRLRGRKYRRYDNTSKRTLEKRSKYYKKPSSPSPEKPKPSVKEYVINIRNEHDLNNYKEKVKNVSVITDFLRSNNFGEQYVKYIEKYAERTEKVFQKIKEFDEETTDIIVTGIVKLVENNLLSYLKGCYLGMRGNNSEERKEFYRKFAYVMEQYLQSIGIYEKKINVGVSIRENNLIDMFKLITKPTDEESLINKIEEIELQPHYIKFINEDDEEDFYYLEGLCVVFVKNE